MPPEVVVGRTYYTEQTKALTISKPRLEPRLEGESTRDVSRLADISPGGVRLGPKLTSTGRPARGCNLPPPAGAVKAGSFSHNPKALPERTLLEARRPAVGSVASSLLYPTTSNRTYVGLHELRDGDLTTQRAGGPAFVEGEVEKAARGVTRARARVRGFGNRPASSS